uniref:Endonuclease/exonuclease/phosphatase domain-containing protein n=1 Tax=Knipowitschia caucasica TaxID=637954 RepID=A0AAV2KDP3_KNICA
MNPNWNNHYAPYRRQMHPSMWRLPVTALGSSLFPRAPVGFPPDVRNFSSSATRMEQEPPLKRRRSSEKLDVKSLLRQWDSCSDASSPAEGDNSFDFTVMSYNILSQDLLLDNMYLYKHCPPEVLSWNYRLRGLLTELRLHDADILCLQEVQEDHFVTQIRPALDTLGYKCVYKCRTGDKTDGCAVAYRRSRLSLLRSNPVEFYRPGDALLDRDNVGLVVQLSPASDPTSSFCVANTHLLYNPRRGDIKLAQLAILLAELQRSSRLPDGSSYPVVLCGDFNSTPSSPLYSFLTSGRLDFRDLHVAMVSGQEPNPRGFRRISSPPWSDSLGITRSCVYRNQETSERNQNQETKERNHQDPNQTEEPASTSPTVMEGAISALSVEDQVSHITQEIHDRWSIEHSLKLKSVYDHRLSPDGRDEITTCHSRTAITVDYILYSRDSAVGPSSSSAFPVSGRGLQLLQRLSLVGLVELEQVNSLPNEHHCSDHLPLLARFRLRR